MHTSDGNPRSSGRGKARRDERDQRRSRQPRGADHKVLVIPLDDQGSSVPGQRVAGRGEPGPVVADGDLPGTARHVLAGLPGEAGGMKNIRTQTPDATAAVPWAAPAPVAHGAVFASVR